MPRIEFSGCRVPDPPEGGPEFDGCPFDYSDVDEGDECIGCMWYEICKKCFREER